MADDIAEKPVQEVATENVATITKVKQEIKSEAEPNRNSEQFKKLTESNKRLLEANRLLQESLVRQKQVESVAVPDQKQNSIDQFVEVDPISGEQYVNQDKLKKVIEDTSLRASRAEAAVSRYMQEQQELVRQQQRLDQQKQEKEAFESFPEVNPSSERFDRELSKRTEALLLHSYMHPEDYGGYALSFKQAAEQAQGQTATQAKSVQQAAESAKGEAAVNAKEQATSV